MTRKMLLKLCRIKSDVLIRIPNSKIKTTLSRTQNWIEMSKANRENDSEVRKLILRGLKIVWVEDFCPTRLRLEEKKPVKQIFFAKLWGTKSVSQWIAKETKPWQWSHYLESERHKPIVRWCGANSDRLFLGGVAATFFFLIDHLSCLLLLFIFGCIVIGD